MARLLCDSDPPVVCVERPAGSSGFVLLCDHAGRILPRALGDLGVPHSELTRHIAWDIGIAEVGRRLALHLGACLIMQNYSRLVIDANRHPNTEQSIVSLSERTRIPGNERLSNEEVEVRAREIFHPYHDRIRQELDARHRASRPTVLVLLHSFTPVFLGECRPWHAGVLYNRDRHLAHALLSLLRQEEGLVVGDNQPYAANDATDYSLCVHGEGRGLPHVELEIRQDLIEHAEGQALWAERLARLLPRAATALFPA
ncbi:MAG TPA: N-formylglutamate amidohydrolase [Polyangiales bacterium]